MHIYIYVCIYLCVCVCAFVSTPLSITLLESNHMLLNSWQAPQKLSARFWYWIFSFRVIQERHAKDRYLMICRIEKSWDQTPFLHICWSIYDCLIFSLHRISCLNDCRTVSRPDTSPTDTSPRTNPRLTLPRRTLPRRTFPRTDNSPTGHFPERHFPYWTFLH